MCDYITVAFPKQLTSEFVACVPHGMATDSRYPNPTFAANIPADYTQILLTHGGCSCELYFYFTEEQANDVAPPKKDVEKIRRKYERMNWSSAKMERAIQSHLTQRTPPIENSIDVIAGFQPEVKELVSEFVTKYGSILILVHRYCNAVSKEIFKLKQKETIRLSAFQSKDFIAQRDVLYTVTAK
ncbi:MAG: hypothetical protein Q4D98_04685 [Planctomycetia bacterium]|nr:hypothetical protein [Planctomycetia bacterium]